MCLLLCYVSFSFLGAILDLVVGVDVVVGVIDVVIVGVVSVVVDVVVVCLIVFGVVVDVVVVVFGVVCAWCCLLSVLSLELYLAKL